MPPTPRRQFADRPDSERAFQESEKREGGFFALVNSEEKVPTTALRAGSIRAGAMAPALRYMAEIVLKS